MKGTAVGGFRQDTQRTAEYFETLKRVYSLGKAFSVESHDDEGAGKKAIVELGVPNVCEARVGHVGTPRAVSAAGLSSRTYIELPGAWTQPEPAGVVVGSVERQLELGKPSQEMHRPAGKSMALIKPGRRRKRSIALHCETSLHSTASRRIRPHACRESKRPLKVCSIEKKRRREGEAVPLSEEKGIEFR